MWVVPCLGSWAAAPADSWIFLVDLFLGREWCMTCFQWLTCDLMPFTSGISCDCALKHAQEILPLAHGSCVGMGWDLPFQFFNIPDVLWFFVVHFLEIQLQDATAIQSCWNRSETLQCIQILLFRSRQQLTLSSSNYVLPFGRHFHQLFAPPSISISGWFAGNVEFQGSFLFTTVIELALFWSARMMHPKQFWLICLCSSSSTHR